MRIVIAATVLAQALPVGSLFTNSSNNPSVFGIVETKTALNQFSSSKIERRKGNGNHHPTPSNVRTGHLLHAKVTDKKVLRNVVGKGRMLKPLQQSSSSSSNAKASECNPDVGILACGLGKYCKQDHSSTIGGVCSSVASKSLTLLSADSYYSYYPMQEHICDSNSTEVIDACDCSDFDYPTGTKYGSLTCLHPTKCDDDCPTLCSSYHVYYVRYTNGDPVLRRCYYYTQPYEQTFCVSHTTSYQNCKLYLNGVQCNFCDMLANDYYGEYDCTNVGMSKGGLWGYDQGIVLPIYTSTCSSSSNSPPSTTFPNPTLAPESGGFEPTDRPTYLPTTFPTAPLSSTTLTPSEVLTQTPNGGVDPMSSSSPLPSMTPWPTSFPEPTVTMSPSATMFPTFNSSETLEPTTIGDLGNATSSPTSQGSNSTAPTVSSSPSLPPAAEILVPTVKPSVVEPTSPSLTSASPTIESFDNASATSSPPTNNPSRAPTGDIASVSTNPTDGGETDSVHSLMPHVAFAASIIVGIFQVW